jgi:hypothetical protein
VCLLRHERDLRRFRCDGIMERPLERAHSSITLVCAAIRSRTTLEDRRLVCLVSSRDDELRERRANRTSLTRRTNSHQSQILGCKPCCLDMLDFEPQHANGLSVIWPVWCADPVLQECVRYLISDCHSLKFIADVIVNRGAACCTKLVMTPRRG